MSLERCCLCPNVGKKYSTVCPGIPNTLHPKPTACKYSRKKKRSVRAKKL